MKKMFCFLGLVFMLNCEQIIEVEDISNEAITILAPADNMTLGATTVNFSWEPLEFAEHYQLQIANPNFDTPEAIIEDTLVTNTAFVKVLSANNYQWRIRAKNFSYETDYTTQNLTIED